MIGMYPPHKGEPEAPSVKDSTGLLQQMTELSEEAKQSLTLPLRTGGPAHRTFVALSVPKKLVVMLGGPLMNLLISVVLMVVLVSGIGLPAVTPTVQSVSECVVAADAPADVSCEGRPAAPALAAGIRPGDVLQEIDGQRIDRWSDVTTAVRAAEDRTVEVVVERNGEVLRLEATMIVDARPVLDEDGAAVLDADGNLVTEQVGFLGVSGTPDLVPQSPAMVPEMAWSAFTQTGRLVVTLPVRLYEVGQAAFGDAERDPNGPLGVVGVSRLAGEVASADQPGFELREKTGTMISMLASLNMALFVFNLVPLLPLDGGHVAGALLEGVRRFLDGFAAGRIRPCRHVPDAPAHQCGRDRLHPDDAAAAVRRHRQADQPVPLRSPHGALVTARAERWRCRTSPRAPVLASP